MAFVLYRNYCTPRLNSIRIDPPRDAKPGTMPRFSELRRRRLAFAPGSLLTLALSLLLVLSAIAGADFPSLAQRAQARYGTEAMIAVHAWEQLVLDNGDRSDEEKLKQVNDFFNKRVRFDDDILIWQQPDYWATPLETLGRAAGDCEDFAIAKFMTLKLLGVDQAKMRMIYVRARIGGPASRIEQAHMVLGYYATPAAEPLVLDSLIGEIRPASRRTDLFPVFSFNDQGLWIGGAAKSSADPTERLSRWRDLLARMRDDGLE